MPLSERQRDPRYKTRKRKKYGSIYGYGIKFPSSRSSGGDAGDFKPANAGLPPLPPSIADILANDPIYQAAMGNLTAYGISDKASRDAAAKRAFVDFGDPHGSTDAMFDPTTRALARKNTEAGLSVLARLKQAADDARRGLVNNLAARGMTRSGETGWGLGRQQLASDQNQYDARSRLLDYFSGLQAAFLQTERERQAAKDKAAADAVANADTSTFSAVGPNLPPSITRGTGGVGIPPPPPLAAPRKKPKKRYRRSSTTGGGLT